MRLLLRHEYEQHCCAISASYLWATPYFLSDQITLKGIKGIVLPATDIGL
jgi:hypothetical protein